MTSSRTQLPFGKTAACATPDCETADAVELDQTAAAAPSSKTAAAANSFCKTAACPASSTLLSYRLKKVSRKVAALVRLHLDDCEFCNAELPLLAHHKPTRRLPRAPQIPTNLRILAESILCQKL